MKMEITKDQKLVYLSRRQMEVKQLKESLERESLELAQVIGHRLRGHGETFGFPSISEFGTKIEEAVKEKDLDRLRLIIKSLGENVEEKLRLINLQ